MAATGRERNGEREREKVERVRLRKEPRQSGIFQGIIVRGRGSPPSAWPRVTYKIGWNWGAIPPCWGILTKKKKKKMKEVERKVNGESSRRRHFPVSEPLSLHFDILFYLLICFSFGHFRRRTKPVEGEVFQIRLMGMCLPWGQCRLRVLISPSGTGWPDTCFSVSPPPPQAPLLPSVPIVAALPTGGFFLAEQDPSQDPLCC